MLLLAVLLFVGACSDETRNPDEKQPCQGEDGGQGGDVRPHHRTGDDRGIAASEITLGDDPGGKPDVVIRLEGDPETTFSGLCSVGEKRSVLSGQVPKRFAFDLKDGNSPAASRNGTGAPATSRWSWWRRNHQIRPADERTGRRHKRLV